MIVQPEDREFPTVPLALLKELERLFPVYTPGLDTPERKIWYELGKRAVVTMLRDEYEKQRERPMG